MDHTQPIKYFRYEHLPPNLQEVSKIFHEAAVKLNSIETTDPGEKMEAFRKLLEAKDCAVRAALA